MKRRLGILLVLVGIIAIVIVIVRFFLMNRTPKTGKLKIESTPTASIFLDNRHVGRTPYESDVDAGEYTIKLIPESAVDDVAAWQGKIRVGGNLLTYINRDLAPTELSSAGEVLWLEKITSSIPELTITTIPDSATVLLDEQERGVSPLSVSNLSAGDHTLTITSPGFLSRTLKIRATSGYKLNASIQLALSPLDTPTRNTESSSSASASSSLLPDQDESAASGSANTEDPPRPFVIITQTPTGFLRVRQNATTASEEVGQVDPGDKFTIEDTEDGWYQIEYEPGALGWVSGQYVQVEE